jgi:hypothetical protein
VEKSAINMPNHQPTDDGGRKSPEQQGYADHKPIADARVPLVNGGSRFSSTFFG